MTNPTHEPTHEPTRCQRMEDPLRDLVSGTLSDRDLVALSAHLRRCDDCAELFDLHVDLSNLGTAGQLDDQGAVQSTPSIADVEPGLPTDREFERARRSVLADLGIGNGSPGVARIPTPHPSAHRQWPSQGARWAAAAVFALGLFGLGWLSARPSWSPADAGELAMDTQRDLPTALLTALPSSGVDEAALQQFVIDNLRLRDVDGDRVAVSFDAATYVETVLPRTDPLVREAVVRSIRGGSDLGGRINAIEQTRALDLSAPVRDALITAMLEDPDIAVRLQAQQRLAQTEVDEAVVAASLRVLETEESVQMRLLAVDMLSARQVAPDRLLEAIEAGRPEPGNALRVRAAQYERLY